MIWVVSLFRRLRALTNRRRVLGVGGCDEEIRAAPFLLCITVLQAGTRSEGRIGRLFLDGREMVADPGAVVEVDTPEGTLCFTYLGEERPHLWSVSGWTVEAITPEA